MAHVIWKGHVAFGLVSIPVEVYSAVQRDDLDLKLVDRRDLAPVGYRRINKNTGQEVPPDDVVRAFPLDGEEAGMVVVEDEELQASRPENDQTVRIVDFVDADSIPHQYFEKPYWLAPGKKGEKPYALLAQALTASGKVGLAEVVIARREHLACVVPQGPLLLLEQLRYEAELRKPEDLGIDAEELKKIPLSAKEKDLAKRLIADLTTKFDPSHFEDEARVALIEKLRKKAPSKPVGAAARKKAPKKPAASKRGKVIDLMEVLQRSVEETGKTKRRKKA